LKYIEEISKLNLKIEIFLSEKKHQEDVSKDLCESQKNIIKNLKKEFQD
jgi:hypothetical protein